MSIHKSIIFIGFYLATVACCYAGESDDFRPISFKCPDENNGFFEVEKKASDGGRVKVQITYDGLRISRIIASVAPPRLPYKVMADGSLYDQRDARKRKFFEDILPGHQPIKERVCDDPNRGTRFRYFEIVERNRKALEGAEPPSSHSNKPSQ